MDNDNLYVIYVNVSDWDEVHDFCKDQDIMTPTYRHDGKHANVFIHNPTGGKYFLANKSLSLETYTLKNTWFAYSFADWKKYIATAQKEYRKNKLRMAANDSSAKTKV